LLRLLHYDPEQGKAAIVVGLLLLFSGTAEFLIARIGKELKGVV